MAQDPQDREMEPQKKSRCEEFRDWFGGPHFCLYITYVMGAWGDRMWMFACGLYLVSLAGGVLRLAAILGFTGGSCILLLGGVIGNWVDVNPRLKVVRISLFVQNLSVALCAVCVCLTLYYTHLIHEVVDGYLRYVSETLIIVLAIVASLASVAYKIAIEKDWIIIVAGNNSAQLANLNARMRAIDLLCSLLAPFSVGVLMSYTSLVVSAIVIAAWNVVSVVVEYALLTRVYRLVPRLAVKHETPTPEPVEMEVVVGEEEEEGDEGEEKQENGAAVKLGTEASTLIDQKQKAETVSEENISSNAGQPDAIQNGLEPEHSPLENQPEPVETSSLTRTNNKAATAKIAPDITDSSSDIEEPTKKKKGCASTLFRPFRTFVNGWKTYARQKVVFASLSLSFLYMTVLGLDSVTAGYIYATGVAEIWVGVSIGISGLAGVFGTFVFTWLRRRNGLERTGLVAFNLEILCLCFCVASVWAPGSPFDPYFKLPKPGLTPLPSEAHPGRNCSARKVFDMDIVSVGDGEDEDKGLNRTKRGVVFSSGEMFQQHYFESQYTSNVIGGMLHKDLELDAGLFYSGSISDSTQTQRTRSKRDKTNSSNPTIGYTDTTLNTYDTLTNISNNGTLQDPCDPDSDSDPPLERGINIAIMLLLIGIVTSRTGLWMADLTITQLMQENVAEKERGIVNGVQNSLNMFMDMLKFALVIIIPYVETYGYLIILSFTFICCGGMLFAYHSWRVRGHLFHFDKICGPCRGSNQAAAAALGRSAAQGNRDPTVELCAV